MGPARCFFKSSFNEHVTPWLVRSLASLNKKWAKVCWTRWRKKKRNKQRPFSQWELQKEILVEAKSKLSCLHLLWFDVKSVEGKKRTEKVKEIKGKGHLGIWGQEKRRSPSKWEWGQCSLKELREWEQVKEKRKIEGVRENCERYIVRKKAMSEKKNRFFFFTQIVSLNVVISI